jgi:diguanylate cyclase (GGDEF)-like protein/PAS domain S-box-containing protein
VQARIVRWADGDADERFVVSFSDFSGHQRLQSTLRSLSEQQRRFVAMAEMALSTASLDEVMQRILELLREAIPNDSSAFYWWDAGRGALRRAIQLSDAPSCQDWPDQVKLGEGMLGRAAVRGEPAVEVDQSCANCTLGCQHHLMALPVLVRGSLLGAFRVSRQPHPFSEDELELVGSFLRHAAIALENARLLRQVRMSEEQYRSLFTACLDVVYMSTPSGLFLDVNPAGMSLLGYQTYEEILLADIGNDLYADPSDREEFKRLMAEHGFVRDREVRLRRVDGQLLTVQETATAVRDENGSVMFYRGILRDVTERKQAEEALAYQALHDGLTGLPNRVLLRDRLQQAIELARREDTSAALLLMDLDRFKEVNDTLGHAAGDLLLVEVARRVRMALRASATVARLGGDEFAMVLPGADTVGAQAAALRILEAVEQPFVLPDQGINVDVRGSIGIALYPTHGEVADEILRRADVAMYEAKRSSGGHVMYLAEHDHHSPTRLTLAGELRRALEAGSGEFLLHYQPQLALGSAVVTGVEALARWGHAQRGWVPPDEFIGLAERTGLIRPLTDYVLELALQQCRVWLGTGLELPVAVNLSMRDLQDPRLPETIDALLARHAVPSQLLRLEITESVLMADPGRVVTVLARLRALGLEVAIDDFGTGYASLAYLADLPADTLKIDRTFVQGLVGRPRHAAIVRSTIELAHNLGLRVVAEGVEDAETWEALKALGCDEAQGYLMGRPMPAADIATWLARTTQRAA